MVLGIILKLVSLAPDPGVMRHARQDESDGFDRIRYCIGMKGCKWPTYSCVVCT